MTSIWEYKENNTLPTPNTLSLNSQIEMGHSGVTYDDRLDTASPTTLTLGLPICTYWVASQRCDDGAGITPLDGAHEKEE